MTSSKGDWMRTLLLDSTFFPVKIISWQKAMILLLTGRAEVVDEYDDFKIRSVTDSYNLPKILRLYNKHLSSKSVKFSRMNVYWRDNFKCQYCYKKFPTSHLTFDHVMPVSRGGGTSWQNVVTCCVRCNNKKANKTPQEAGMTLMKKPVMPKWSPQLCLRLKKDDPSEWTEWFPSKVT
ncbi:MAG: HNH endonuclease [Deltaproteobacteria bacterium]|jgi:5-methylcytosine-specific restriction endonuclease McrA|nr:MAG: HNH endonuclease [Deltaproteobacteria bacterium]TNF27384.1 MAG: HNH endonuclease [Deltaproteobacteria bacterium]